MLWSIVFVCTEEEGEVEDCKCDGDDERFEILSDEGFEYFMLFLLFGKSMLSDGT